MKVYIDDNNLDNSNENYFEFVSSYGKGRAIWNGKKPSIKTIYDIEIEIPQVLCWGMDIVKSGQNEFSIIEEKEYIILVGKLDSIEEDGCTMFKLEDDTIILETQGVPFNVGDFVKIRVSHIIFYDVNL